MSATNIHQYFDAEMIKKDGKAYYKTEMENGLTATIENWLVSGSVESHLNVNDENGIPVFQNHTSGNDVEHVVIWANSEINKNFPRKKVLLEAIEYQEKQIAHHKAILDAVGCELSVLDARY